MTCIVVVNVFNKNAQNIAKDIEIFLTSNGHICVAIPYSGKNELFPSIIYDCAITLGGDGTVLYAARQCAISGKPVFPVNFGEFGFIAGTKPENWESALRDFLAGTSTPTKRSLLYAELLRDGNLIDSGNALNDVVISSKNAAQTIRLNIETDGIPFGKFKADGIIVATSTGSTAYSAAAGGPIVDPALDAIILNPVSAFSLSNRPLVLPSETVLHIAVLPSRNSDFVLSYDGQVHTDIKEGDCIIVKQSPHKVLLVGCSSAVFYAALRSKLHWSGGGPLA